MAKAAKPQVKRAYLKQSDVPSAPLADALRMPQAIFDHYAGKACTPLQIAKALDVDPKGSQLRVLSGAAIAFGLIEGGAQAANISVTPLATRIIRPKAENDDIAAKREAVLRPRIFGDFLRQYDGHLFPRSDIALNVIEDMGVPRDKAAEVLERIEKSARLVGFIEEIKGKMYVALNGATEPNSLTSSDDNEDSSTDSESTDAGGSNDHDIQPAGLAKPKVAAAEKASELAIAAADDMRRKRVFITHGQNRDLVDPIRKLLEFGEMEAVVSVERQSVSKPVPEKVMDDMRRAGAAIIHVDADKTIIDKDGNDLHP